jgi:hypothetical protein
MLSLRSDSLLENAFEALFWNIPSLAYTATFEVIWGAQQQVWN